MKKLIVLILIPIIIFLGIKINIFNLGIKPSWGEKSKFEILETKKDAINIEINGEKIDLKNPVFIYENRYYIALNDIVKKNNGEIKKTKDLIKINLFDKEVEVDKESWTVKDKNLKLKKEVINHKNNLYISLIDFANIFDFDSRWSYENKLIKLYDKKKNSSGKEYSGNGKQVGAIRFEDVTVDGTGSEKSSQYLEALRVMGRRLGDRGVPYYIAWIPRYINPNRNIDADPSKVDSFPLAELVYTLDYLTYNKGYIGLHGYTHQRDKEVSGVGSEFGKEYPSVEELNSRVKKALEIAEYLDIDITFFEAPHYLITNEQNRELEKYFKYIFNNYNCEEPLNNQVQIVKSTEKGSYYIPTPLYYVADGTGDTMVKSIEKLSKNYFVGLFYHPFIELKNMEFREDENGIPEVKYKGESILNKLINALEKRNIKLIDFNEIEKK